MNASDLVERLARQTGLTQRTARNALDVALAEIAGELAANRSVTLRGFGTFSPRDVPSRRRRHPKTGMTIESAARRSVVFRAGRDLASALNRSND